MLSYMKKLTFRILLASAAATLFMVFPGAVYAGDGLNRVFLKGILVEKGIEESLAIAMLNDDRIRFDNVSLIANLCNTGSCGRAKSTQAAKPGSVQQKPKTTSRYVDLKYIILGRKFISDRREMFNRVETEYGVPAEVITAILIIESKLGTLKSPYFAFNSYLNMAALTDPQFLEDFIRLNVDTYPGIDSESNRQTAVKRGKWAAREIVHLMKLSDELDMDPLEFKSSYAGAIGPAQFIPSSVRNFFIDGNEDGIKDPFSMEDAIASIANYLKKCGWNEDDESRRQAVWSYNHHNYYVNSVMGTFRELAEPLNEDNNQEAL